MKIGIISNKSKYKELFNASEHECSAVMLKTTESYVPIDVFFLDGEQVTIDELATFREEVGNIPVFYKLHNIKSEIHTQNIKRICAAHKITPINEYYTMEQDVQEILQILTKVLGNGSKRVISFFGTHSGAGVSTTVFNVAHVIAKQVENRVLVLSLNAWDPADYFFTYQGSYLNDLKTDLKMKSLNAESLMEAVYEYNGFYHLAGNRDIKMQRYYTNEEIEHLISVAKECFDVILIDGGTHFDTANATQAFVSSNLKFIVTTQDDKGYRGYFPHTFQQLLEPAGGKRTDFMLIINQFKPDMSLISEKDLELELEISRIATIPDMDVLGSIAIRQKKLMYETADHTYRRSIHTIANAIISEAKLKERVDVELDSERRRSLFPLFKRREKEEVRTW